MQSVILLETDSTLCGFDQVGNGKNRKEVDRKFSTHTQKSINKSKLALICIFCISVVSSKFKTLFVVCAAMCSAPSVTIFYTFLLQTQTHRGKKTNFPTFFPRTPIHNLENRQRYNFPTLPTLSTLWCNIYWLFIWDKV